jgi:hypothetical protein
MSTMYICENIFCSNSIVIMLIPFLNLYLEGEVVEFRSFLPEHVLMCKIHEQDTVSVLKYVLCSLMNMSEFFV